LKYDPLDCAIDIRVLLRFFKQNFLVTVFPKGVFVSVGDRFLKVSVAYFAVALSQLVSVSLAMTA
jgi:hypothetical protein